MSMARLYTQTHCSRLVVPVARSPTNAVWSTRSSTLLIFLGSFVSLAYVVRSDGWDEFARCRWLGGFPACGGGEREVPQRARKVPPQVVIRVGPARLIRKHRDEDPFVRPSRQQHQQSAQLVHDRLGHPRTERLHHHVVGSCAVWPVGGRGDLTEVG